MSTDLTLTRIDGNRISPGLEVRLLRSDAPASPDTLHTVIGLCRRNLSDDGDKYDTFTFQWREHYIVRRTRVDVMSLPCYILT